VAARAPDAPTTFTLLSSTASTINFSWIAPYNGGTPITYYKIYWDSGTGTSTFTEYAFTVNPTNSFLVNSGLTAGTFYQFKVAAVNLVGDG
jgi:hypothetical protein